MNSLEHGFLCLPLTEVARQTAQQFAKEQPTPEKSEQVCLNTLAVWAVNDYLQLMRISTDLTAGDSWNPVVRLCADVADLEVTGVGRLECRPLRAYELNCSIPPEVWEDRIGYVVVQIDELLQEATLLGFTPTVAADEPPLVQLQPPEALLTHLHQLRQPKAATQSATARTLVNLSQWLEGVFETGWVTVEALLNSSDPSLAVGFRNVEGFADIEREQPDTKIRRAKLLKNLPEEAPAAFPHKLNLRQPSSDRPLALVVELSSESELPTCIRVQVCPTGSQLYLPPNLQLTVLDESGAVFLEVQSIWTDNYIQLQFSGQVGERFSVQVTFDEVSVRENFVI